MHTLHRIAIELDYEDPESIAQFMEDSPERIPSAIENAVDNALEGYGNGDVWDWYSIGGRWDGIFGLGGNFINYGRQPEFFRECVGYALEGQAQNFREARDNIFGKQITPEEVDNHNPFGFPIDDKEDYVKRTNERLKKSSEAFQALAAIEAPHEVGKDLDSTFISIYLRRMANLVAGYYDFESVFYDGAYGTTRPHDMWKRCEENPEAQWLVAVDLHN